MALSQRPQMGRHILDREGHMPSTAEGRGVTQCRQASTGLLFAAICILSTSLLLGPVIAPPFLEEGSAPLSQLFQGSRLQKLIANGGLPQPLLFPPPHWDPPTLLPASPCSWNTGEWGRGYKRGHKGYTLGINLSCTPMTDQSAFSTLGLSFPFWRPSLLIA